MSELQLHEGRGSFVFPDVAARTGTLRVFYFCPKPAAGDARIVVAMHGFDRAASDFRDVLASPAGRTGQIILGSGIRRRSVPRCVCVQLWQCQTRTDGRGGVPATSLEFPSHRQVVRTGPDRSRLPVGRPSVCSAIRQAPSTCCATSHSPGCRRRHGSSREQRLVHAARSGDRLPGRNGRSRSR